MSQFPSQSGAAQPKLKESASAGIRASLAAVVISLALGAVKIITGSLGSSYVLIADGVESMLDVADGLVVAGSLKLAAQAPDEEYPFGKGKVEPAAALMIATGLLAAAVAISMQSVREIVAPLRAPAAYTLLVLALVVGTKELLFRYLSRAGESIGSHVLRTDAWHRRSNSLTSLAAFIGISIALLGGEGYEQADGWAALFAAAVIAFNGLQLLRQGWREMIDVALLEYVIDEICEISRQVEGVSGIDMCRVRKSGLGLWVDGHVEVPGDMTVRNGHEIAHRVKDALLASRHNVMDALVHIEPID